MDVHRLSRAEARRVAVRAQQLTQDRPADVLEAVRGVGQLQLDPISAVAPSADLVMWSRLGAAYSPQELRDAADELALLEFRGSLRVAEDVEPYLAEMAAWPGDDAAPYELGQRDWVEDNQACRQDILELLRADGPLPERELPDTCVRPWASSGWNNAKNLKMMLALLVKQGDVAVAGRRGRDRLWDLASRIYPEDPGLRLADAARLRHARRLESFGIARSRGPATPGDPLGVHDAGEPATVDGLDGEWRVDPAQLDRPFTGRTALLSPFDRLVADRRRMGEIFGFDYVLEMYKPAAKRRWGYYALPILHGDRLVGKLDAKADRRAGVLDVTAVHEDQPFGRALTRAVDAEIADLATWLDLEPVRHDRG